MKIQINTHIFLWMLSCPEKLDTKRRYALESRTNEMHLICRTIRNSYRTSAAWSERSNDAAGRRGSAGRAPEPSFR